MMIKLAAVTALPILCALMTSVAVSETPSPTAVGIDNFKFSPVPLIIDKGAAVTWTNHDDIPHSIVLPDLQQRSKPLDSDQSYSLRFDKSGSFSYICGLHPFMKGQIVVR